MGISATGKSERNETGWHAKARCNLERHLAWKWGYTVHESDAVGPVLISVTVMGVPQYWKRIGAAGRELTMEATTLEEQHEAPQAEPTAAPEAPARSWADTPKREAGTKKRRGG